MAMEVMPLLAHQLAAVLGALWGLSHKVLVLDLDNTLWGGVIGDEGVEGIQVGSGSARAEAHADLQRYAAALRQRGILLAVASKNDEENARAGFDHDESVLRLEDFSAFQANWEEKPANLSRIASELNVGIDSLVFVDDNPAEQDYVRAQLPALSVPYIGDDISDFVPYLDRACLFETVSLTGDDLKRSGQYQDERQRMQHQARFKNHGEYLASLAMRADILPFDKKSLSRITQLINKTNQFNLTTRRCSETEVSAMMADENRICLYARLQDKFGDNGLVAVLSGVIRENNLHVDLWLMSCRVLQRGLEYAMFEVLCGQALQKQVKQITAYYKPTPKNKLVAHLYASLGFHELEKEADQQVWQMALDGKIPSYDHHIEVHNG
jgi:FkbH-like protein